MTEVPNNLLNKITNCIKKIHPPNRSLPWEGGVPYHNPKKSLVVDGPSQVPMLHNLLIYNLLRPL